MDPRNRKKQWGVVLGNHTPQHPNPASAAEKVGWWCGEEGAHPGPPAMLFYNKQEAEAWAINRSKYHHWNYSAKKYNPRIENGSTK